MSHSDKLPKSKLTKADVTAHKIERLYEGYFHVDKYTLSIRRHDGSVMGPFTREIFERGSAVVCLPYDPIRDEVVLIEQFRPGPFAAGETDCWCLEAVAGIIGSDETPEDVAIRESLEEANCQITKLVPAGRFSPSGGACTEFISSFIGICDTSNIGGICGIAEESEDIKVYVVPFSDALNAALEGEISNLAAVHLLQWLALKKGSLDL